MMKSNKGFYFGIAIFIITIIVGFGIKSGLARQAMPIQTASASSEPSAKSSALTRLSTSEATPKPMIAPSASAAFQSAALRNAQLQSEMSWAFGGKSQRGWQLYAPLISGFIGSEADSASSDFAMQLSRWQKERGIEANGILDNYVWSQMISTWQSQRIKDRIVPTGDQVVTIPASDCYDPSRPEELRRAERETYAAYKRMVAAAAEELGLERTATGELAAGEKYFKIISALRTPEYQAHLRAQSPNSGRAGLAVSSPHFTGRALDIYVGGEPVSTKDENRAIQTQTAAYKWLAKNASRFGFRPYFYEPWHWEYVGK
jgi:zinc D-Ala-D-Ala carboxypeptidase